MATKIELGLIGALFIGVPLVMTLTGQEGGPITLILGAICLFVILPLFLFIRYWSNILKSGLTFTEIFARFREEYLRPMKSKPAPEPGRAIEVGSYKAQEKPSIRQLRFGIEDLQKRLSNLSETRGELERQLGELKVSLEADEESEIQTLHSIYKQSLTARQDNLQATLDNLDNQQIELTEELERKQIALKAAEADHRNR